MTDFVYEFLDLGESVHKDVRLVKAPIELVRCDDSIASDEGQIKKSRTWRPDKRVLSSIFAWNLALCSCESEGQ